MAVVRGLEIVDKNYKKRKITIAFNPLNIDNESENVFEVLNPAIINQVLWSIDDNEEIKRGQLESEIQLEEILEKNINLLNPDWMIIGRQVIVHGKYIDLVAIDRAGDLIVIELKKDKTPREVTAQILDYGSIISKYQADDIANMYNNYKNEDIGKAFNSKFGIDLDAEDTNTNTQLIIVATSMDASTERIINYLNEFSLNINVMLFDVSNIDGKKVLSRTWMIDYEEDINTSVYKKNYKKKEWNGEFYVSFGADDDRS